MKKNNDKKRKFSKKITLLFIVLVVALVGYAFAKYKSDTPHQIIKLLTKYNIKYETNSGQLNNPEKYNSYYSYNGLTLPTEEDITRTGHDFTGWYLDNNFTGEAITEIQKGEWGDKFFFAAWHAAEYDLKVQTLDSSGNTAAGLPSEYAIVIGKDNNGNDNVVELDSNGIIKIGKYQQVSIRVPYSENANSSGLSFDDEKISISMRYNEGDQYIYYDFEMPKKDLIITYNTATDINNYIDISKSPIIFEKGVVTNDSTIVIDGFWYKESVNGLVYLKEDPEKGYFYEWDYTKPFYVTSNNNETQNQLILVDGLTVYFKETKLVATNSYTSRVSGLAIDNKSLSNFTAEGSLTNVANIVLENSVNYKYTTNLYFLGDNIINCISQSKIVADENYYGTINLYGINELNKQSTLQLGSVIENGVLNITDLTINEYSNTTYQNNSSLLFYITAKYTGWGDVNVKGSSKINTPNKWAYLKCGTTMFDDNSTANLKYIYAYMGTKVMGESTLEVQNDLIWGRSLNVNENGKLIVNGNILNLNHHNNQNPNTTINTNKYIIVKGNRAEFNYLIMSKGTVIANLVSIAYSCNYSGGTIIANQLSNYIADIVKINLSTASVTTNQTTFDNTYPFKNHSDTAQVAGKYILSGGNIYLFGSYKVNENSYYDLNYTALTSENPIGEIINNIGTLTDSTSMPTESYLLEKINSINTISECMVLGNKSYNTDTILREFYLKGTNFYATGNLNFSNNTYISNGNIITPGNVSSELDLFITGGTINADKVGNSSNVLYMSPKTKLKRWAKTSISENPSITTSRIGAVSNTDKTRSIVQISGGTINPKTDNVIIVHDMYLNYSLSSEFTNPDTNPTNLRYSGNLNSSFANTTLQLVNDDLTILSSITIEKPTEQSSAETNWIFKDLSGYVLDNTTTNGYLTYNNQKGIILPKDTSNEYVVFYAAKSSYNLTVKEGFDYIKDSSVAFSENGSEANIQSKETVSITLNEPYMENKTVIWYYDATGLVHNVVNTDTELNGTITFKMPRANTEIYITSELKLYLDEYEIELNDNGFQVELTNTREDSIFKYNGNYIITQKNTYNKEIGVVYPPTPGKNTYLSIDGKTHSSAGFEQYATFNRLRVNMSNWDGQNKNSITQTISLYKIMQKFNSTTDYTLMFGIDIPENKKAAIRIEGINELCFTRLQTSSDVYFYGDNNEKDIIVVQYTGNIQNWSQGFIGNQNSSPYATGNALIENITYLQRNNNVSLSKSNGTSTFTMNNSIVKLYNYYAGSGIAQGFKKVNINNCDIEMYMTNDTSSAPFGYSTTVNINNTAIDYSVGGLRNSTSLFHYVNYFNVTGTSKLNIKDLYSTDAITRNVTDTGGPGANVVLKDSASLTAERRIRIPNLYMYDNSSLSVTGLNNSKYGGYLFSPNIKIYGGTLNADYIILSGYNSVSNNSIMTVKSYLQNNTNLVNSGVLNITGGTVNAHTFVGGNKKTAIILSSDTTNNTTGTLNAKYIGSIDKLYGIAHYTPKSDEEYVYTYTKIPSKGTKVTVDAGTINVSDSGYLGGMNATVEINGGTINLGTNAVMGMNDADTTTLVNSITSQGNIPSEIVDINITGGTINGDNGYINTPYSTLTVSADNANPSINLKDIIAEHGTININSTKDNYDNPLGAGERVGTIINNNLIAQNIEILNSAIVYAKNAITKNNTTNAVGHLKVDNTSFLYSEVYGSDGTGNSTIDNQGTIVGKRQYSIHYNMSDTFMDQATNPNESHYIEGVGIQLQEPTRYGYIFKKWQDNDGNTVTEIPSGTVGNKELTAIWEAKTVEFVITTSAAETGLTTEEFKKQLDASLGEFNSQGDKFTYKKHLYISYRDLLNTELLLSNYNLSSLVAAQATINNTSINPEGDILDLTSATVTKEIMEYYLNNTIPIEISICEYVNTLAEQ